MASDKLHPWLNPIKKPEIDIANEKMVRPIFSPSAFLIAKVSLLILEASSV